MISKGLSTAAAALLLLLAKAAASAPATGNSKVVVDPKRAVCTDPLVRKEWRNLSQDEQLGYIDAVKCMMSTAGRTSSLYAGVVSAYDDYQALHIAMTEKIHFNGPFLPWHRGFLAIWEADLRATCGYTGAQPYWDWTLDAVSEDAWPSSPLFDDVYGFGGNGAYIADVSNLTQTSAVDDLPGRTGGGCLTTGPFANLTVPMGPDNSTASTPHCLRRDFTAQLAMQTLNQSLVDWQLEADEFAVYDRRVQALDLSLSGITTHGGGHFSVGGMVGEMSNMYSSPGDPLFWLHHGKLDFEWNKWQQLDWPNRSTDIGGPDTMWAYPYNFFGDIPYENITLDYQLVYGELGTTLSVSEVMDLEAGALCYTYE
ncbi:hypothetical protein BJ166DRAFT_49020 [Pestalotiopsis sp. NC0098]|nr:hypothetical protein BJ166DRAFT_49020 [Pestalotiopsis sp. NC0098]